MAKFDHKELLEQIIDIQDELTGLLDDFEFDDRIDRHLRNILKELKKVRDIVTMVDAGEVLFLDIILDNTFELTILEPDAEE